jgi:phosphoglycolate phosphatase-like HAD superfamily hydrolase
MVGDSIDDLRTVLHYRQLPSSQQAAWTFAVQIAPASEAAFWLDQGADAVIPSVNELPALLIT